MNYKMHLGTTFFLALAFLAWLKAGISLETVAWLAIATFSALLPDVDHKDSFIISLAKSAVFILVLALSFKYFGFTGQAIVVAVGGSLALWLIYSAFKPAHRTITHSLLFAVILALLLYLYVGWFIASAVLFGVLAHRVEDFFYDITGIGG